MSITRNDPFCHRHFRHEADCGSTHTRHARRHPLVTCERRARALFTRSNPDSLVPGSSPPPRKE
jgi:hypothetical protein